ncbi:NAD(P)H-binding protein [Agromyces laixinhei]|uniref:NAD(P)H-binding protein n=1 Tax=Agromyces laixinhei TaxID=2585717 RepID=UPI0012EEB486|nr:NAD(P)H-binding protein [Agromyces laixinhei]
MDTDTQLRDPLLHGITLVTAGTGKTGRRVVKRLTARGVPVRVGSRVGDPPFDWSDRDTWKPALAGVDAVYLAYLPDIGAPRAADDIAAFAELATAMGVERAVLLSGRNEPMAQRCEEIVQGATWKWTVVRSSVFSQDFSEAFWLEPVRSGIVAVPAGEDAAEPFVDIEDVADVAAAALTDALHAGRVYELSGPRSVTFAEATAEIATVTGRPVRYQPVTTEQFTAAMTGEGVPPEEAGFVADLFSALFDGRNAATTDGVRRALGRAPRAFRDYVRETAGTGVWGFGHEG